MGLQLGLKEKGRKIKDITQNEPVFINKKLKIDAK